MRLFILLGILAAAAVCGATAKADPALDSKLADLAALKNLIKNDPKNPDLLKRASTVAIEAQDYPDALSLMHQRLALNPNDFGVRSVLPILDMLLHDRPGFERDRANVIETWKASSDPGVKARRSFLIDNFKVDDYTVSARQCYEVGGKFGIKYMFDYAKPGSAISRITLEINYIEGRIAAEINKSKDVYPAISIDDYSGGTHRTIMLNPPRPDNAEPTYDAVRDRVSAYLKAGAGTAVSSLTAPAGKIFAPDCNLPPVSPEDQKVIDTHKL